MITTATATISEMRAPYISRLRMSRPRLSVPSTNFPPIHCGPVSESISDCSLGSFGASAGPNMPRKSSTRTSTPPMMIFTRSHCCSQRGARRPAICAARAAGLVADSRVDDCIEGVNHEIDQHEPECVEEYQTRNQRVVASRHAADQQAANARPGEDRLGNDRTREQLAQLEADDGDDRDQGVLDHVPP